MVDKALLEKRGRNITRMCLAFVVLVLVSLIYMVLSKGLTSFISDGITIPQFFFSTTWNPHNTAEDGSLLVGILPMLSGSSLLTLISCAIALPISIASAIFVVEIAPNFGKKIFRPTIELLVGIPSVVFGLIGLTLIVPFVRSIFGATGYGILSASLVLALMITPTITSLATDEIAAVPNSYRDGSYGLGATRFETIIRVVLPSALPGILTASIMGMARSFGEALAVQMVIGNSTIMPTSLISPASTLTSVLTMSMGNEAQGSVYSNVLWSLAMVLLLMSLCFILLVHLVAKKGAKQHG